MGNFSSGPQTVTDMESVHEPYVLLKYTSNTAEDQCQLQGLMTHMLGLLMLRLMEGERSQRKRGKR